VTALVGGAALVLGGCAAGAPVALGEGSRGSTLGYHPQAHAQAIADVKAFLQTTLARRPPPG
jgi:hypothetical protein